jgi:hypothetical protein
MSIQQIKSGVIADDAVTAEKIDDSTSQLFGFRNRIINGAMVIDQRNAGAAVTSNSTSFVYPVDRWYARGESADGVFTLEQVQDAPTGFTDSVKITVTTQDSSIGSTQVYRFDQRVEGNNVADLAWGTANAKTVTVSFWVRSSLTGTFGAAINNSAGDRSYPFTYSISAADTWEQKSVTIAGETSGTWLVNNGIGLVLSFAIGTGPSRATTANAWASGFFVGATGQTQIIETLNATWYVTGVQLEVGSVATPFERRPYGTELNLCKRYFLTFIKGAEECFGIGFYYSSTVWHQPIRFEQEMRTTPSLTIVTGTDYYKVEKAGGNDTLNGYLFARENQWGGLLYNGSEASGTGGQAWEAVTNNAAAYIGFSAEL